MTIPAKPFDGKEDVGAMEPMFLSAYDGELRRDGLIQLVDDLDRKNYELQRMFRGTLRDAMRPLLRVVNAHFSNAIEGRFLPPARIEQGIRGEFMACAEGEERQREAAAHVQAEEWLDHEVMAWQAPGWALRSVHRLFCGGWSADDRRKRGVEPGEYRVGGVRVGAHRAVSPGAVPRFMRRFEKVYAMLPPSDVLLNAAAMHHRLMWIHPFQDGNGRCARLVTQSFLSTALGPLFWSLSRGLAMERPAYISFLGVCDRARFNDEDGPGSRSEGALIAFTEWFLTACAGEVGFMTECCAPEALKGRIRQWAQAEEAAGLLPEESGTVLVAAMEEGGLTRGRVSEIAGRGVYHGRLIVKKLQAGGLLVTKYGPRSPLHLAFPVSVVPAWFPGLFPDHLIAGDI